MSWGNDLYPTEGDGYLEWRIQRLEARDFEDETRAYVWPKANFQSLCYFVFVLFRSSLDARFPPQAWCDEKGIKLSIIDIIPQVDINKAEPKRS